MDIQFVSGKFYAVDNNGAPAVGYKVWAYKSPDTSTPAVSYLDHECTVANSWPVVLDSRGEAFIYVKIATDFYFTAPTAVDISSPIWISRKIGEQQQNFVTGSATPGTVNNNYVVTTTPAVTALLNNLRLTMTPDVDNAATLVSTVFTGTGINDLTAGGAYVGSTSGSVFTFQIDGVASPDTFKWKKDGGAWTTGVAITGSAQTIIEGITVTFAVITGHTLNDLWAVTVKTPVRVNLDTLGNLLVYKNKGGSIVALDGGDIKAGYPADLILNEALNAWLLINPATPVFSTPTITAIRYRKNVTGAYAQLLADQGYELNCVGTFTVTLLTCPEFSGRFFYIRNSGTGFITVDAGIYNIFGRGISTFVITPGGCFQFQTNGVDWHILTSAGGVLLLEQQDVSAAASAIFTGLIPGLKYRLVYELTKIGAGAFDLRAQFNADGGANYLSNLTAENSVGATFNGLTTAILTTLITSIDADSIVSCKLDFETFLGNNKKVKTYVLSNYLFTGAIIHGAGTGMYTGAADLTSVSIVALGGTFTGRLWLYQVE